MSSTIRFDEIRVTVIDREGSTYHKDWKATANKHDAIRWTLESPDLPYYINEQQICTITIQTGEDTKC